MDLFNIFPIFSFLFGLSLGSFLNACIYRMPRDISVLNPPSHCPYCKNRIRWYDNIPLLSYALLRGRCRDCGAHIPIRYPIVELIEGIFSLSLFLRFGISIYYPLYLYFVSTLIIITFIDLDFQIIPDILSISGIILGLLSSLFFFKHLSWHSSLLGILFGGGGLLLVATAYELLTKTQGMGGGDIKLFAMIGAWMGWRPLPFIILLASILGLIVAIIYLLAEKRGFRTRIPFGPFLSIGAILYLFFERQLIFFYLNLIHLL